MRLVRRRRAPPGTALEASGPSRRHPAVSYLLVSLLLPLVRELIANRRRPERTTPQRDTVTPLTEAQTLSRWGKNRRVSNHSGSCRR
ncbi:hypothetical protein PhiCh1p52 [Natrialba phage PhiCh1]|uniref:Uncharacterized protein n=1 Tax=Natrialba phage PhiCh1 TaxID=114777 RepID=Q8JL05_9CAUD|nr:hypothetical protein PhiCh1p52 [Natrialba phage PhiCh1]AAM88725.1 unknown [Natrialba phage PhiCh1]